MPSNLWKQGVAPKIFLSASRWLVPGVEKEIGDLVRDRIIASGIPETAIFVEYRSQSTYEDAVYSRDWALRSGIASVIVLEDPFGMRRLRWTFKKVFSDTPIQVYCSSVPQEISSFHTERWWTREEDLLYVFEEYVKFIMYWIKY